MVAKAICNWALVDTVTGKLIASKDYDMGTYSMDEAPELSIPRRFRIPKELKFQEVESSKVAMSMIDINMHMNNTVYASKLYDNIDDAEKYFIHRLILGTFTKRRWAASLRFIAAMLWILAKWIIGRKS